ncbi:MAG: hypothetical protein WCW27_00600 [Patescibacteria group bacterium]|jgi:hypothetical protein
MGKNKLEEKGVGGMRSAFRDLVLFFVIMYFVLLILNVLLQSFVDVILPIWLWKWMTIGLMILLLINKNIKSPLSFEERGRG